VRAKLYCIALIACWALGRSAASDREAPVTRADLLGAWRLVATTYSGPDGSHSDPFYQPHSIGLIEYDASGWMSVQISAPHREGVAVAAARVSARGDAQESRAKAAAFDSYYAYFGTWDFDPATSTVTHHVSVALIPDEIGLDYAQSVRFDHGRLVLTTRSGVQGRETVRTKTWERTASAPDRTHSPHGR